MSGKIFISYRRDDTRADARSIDQVMRTRFGAQRVFFDVDTIRKGRDFRKALTEALDASSVLLAVIGPNWLGKPDDQGRRRIDDPNDYVRIETRQRSQARYRGDPGSRRRRQDAARHRAARGHPRPRLPTGRIVTHDNFAHDMEGIQREVADIVGEASRQAPPPA